MVSVTIANTLLIGYARVSTNEQDMQPQLDALAELGVDPRRIYVDHGLSGRNRERPKLREALAACHDGATLVVSKLDRLGRSLGDLRDIARELEDKGAQLNVGGVVYDSRTPIGNLMFNVIGMMAEFEADLISQRTKEGMAVAKARGRLRGKQPTLGPRQDLAVLKRYEQGGETVEEIAMSFNISRTSAYRALDRARLAQQPPETGGIQ